MLFIKFIILEEDKFQDFMKVYDIIREVQTDSYSECQPIAFWEKVIPEYSKANFSHQAKPSGKFPFVEMMKYLHHTLEVDYLSCEKFSPFLF